MKSTQNGHVGRKLLWIAGTLAFLLACMPVIALPTATSQPPAPTLPATLTPFQPATNTPFQPAANTSTLAATLPPSATSTPTLAATDTQTATIAVVGCPAAEVVQTALRANALTLHAAGTLHNWAAKDTLTVLAAIDTSGNANRQFECAYEVKLWEHNIVDRYKNVERYTQDDLQALLAVAKVTYGDSYLGVGQYQTPGQWLKQTEKMEDAIANKQYGAIILYFGLLINSTETTAP